MDASAAAAANVLLTHRTGFGPSFGLEGNFPFVPSVSFQVFGMHVKGICGY